MQLQKNMFLPFEEIKNTNFNHSGINATDSFGGNNSMGVRGWGSMELRDGVNSFISAPLNNSSSDSVFCLSSDLPSITLNQTLYSMSNDSQLFFGVFDRNHTFSWVKSIQSIGYHRCEDVFVSNNGTVSLQITTDGDDLQVENTVFETNESLDGIERTVVINTNPDGSNYSIGFEFEAQILIDLLPDGRWLFGFGSSTNHTFGAISHFIPENSNSASRPFYRVIYGVMSFDSQHFFWSKSVLGNGTYVYTGVYMGDLFWLDSKVVISGWHHAEGLVFGNETQTGLNVSSQLRPSESWITVSTENGTTLRNELLSSNGSSFSHISVRSYKNLRNNSVSLQVFQNCPSNVICKFKFNNSLYNVTSPLLTSHSTLFELNLSSFQLVHSPLYRLGNNVISDIEYLESGNILASIKQHEDINLTGEVHPLNQSLNYPHHAEAIVALYNHSQGRWVWSSLLAPKVGSNTFSNSDSFYPNSFFEIDNNCIQTSGIFTSPATEFFGHRLNNSAGGTRNPAYFIYSLCPDFFDRDGDGYGNTDDDFPDDDLEWADSDNDGVGDNGDLFPNDINEWNDTDEDGVGDNSDVYPNNPSEWIDSDSDGVGDNADAFPNDANETDDSDDDGVGDNMDEFPNDASEISDSDGDGVGDNADAFPNDASKSLDSDGDGVQDSEDSCEGYDDFSDIDNNGVPDGCDSTNENSDTDCSISISIGEVSRSCPVPSEDLDWDGITDSADEDKDGDGRLDVSELSDTIENNDPDTMNMSVVSSPYSDTIHSIEISSVDGMLEISFEYKVNLVEFTAHLPLVAYYNEDGTEIPPQNYDYTLTSTNQLDRLENQMCYSPNLGELMFSSPRFPLWLENLTIDMTLNSQNFECSWIERRDVNLMSALMIIDHMDVANFKETIRYTLTLENQGQFSNTVEIKLPSHEASLGKVWGIKLNHGTLTQSAIAHPWVESLSISIPAPPVADGQEENQQSSVTPSHASGWSFIADVSQGGIDCSGYSSTVTDNLDDIYQQNDIEYNNLNSYHEYRISDDDVLITCSGSLGLEEAMDEDEIEFCIYLFLDGVHKDSGCDSGIFVIASVSGQRQTFDEVIEDFNQDLDDLEQQWQNDLDDLFSPPESSASGSSEDVTFDDLFMLLIIAALIGGVAQSIQKKNKEKAKSKKKRSSKRNRQKEFDRQPSSYVEPEITQPNLEIVEEDNSETTEIYDSIYDSKDVVTQTGLEETIAVDEASYNQPPFSFSGEIDEHGWEVCEYPRSSGVWWWKDYESEQWVIWD